KADGIGLHTRSVLIHHSKDRDSQGNGVLMRVIPFGLQLIEDGYNFEDAVYLMNEDSSLTHQNETIYMANRLSLDLALYGIEVLNKDTYKDLLKRLHRGYSAWVIYTLYIVIKTLKQNYTFLEGFKHIVSHGGDTDTNCAIYGAIKGYKEDISSAINLNDFLSKEIQHSILNIQT
ncbi:ADP-ribosylglycohydrolase family protein, partial [Sulfurospirillum sp.]|nr:ADP-ribosylglycohydrolase family protein [Sulfurospirillum sp.]